jgi:hypothetical protein
MLSYPDRRKFDQLRARWEAADKGGSGATDMGGRKEKQALPDPGPVEPSQHASKFRRKLSHGLAFISNPLSQRKSLSGRQLASDASLAVIAPSAGGTELSPPQGITSEILTPSHPQTAPEALSFSPQSHDPDQTPKPLPKSRTISYIPRPSRSVSEASTDDAGSVICLRTSTLTESKRYTSSKIPCPSPLLSIRRVSSPRLHISSQQLNDSTAVRAFAVSSNGSPSKRSVRSRTAPNLVETASSAHTKDFPVPRRSGFAKPRATSDRNSMLQKELQTTKRVSLQHSHVQGTVLKRESLSVPTTVLNRRSLEPHTLVVQKKQRMAPVTATASRRPSSRMQTSVTKENARPSDLSHAKSSNSRYSNKVSSPIVSPSAKPSAAQSDIEIKTRKEGRKASKVSNIPTDATRQVRTLPHSSTFHHFGRNWETVPSLPQISKHVVSTPVSGPTVNPKATAEISVTNTALTISNYPTCDRNPKRCRDHKNSSTAGKTNNTHRESRLVELKDESTISLPSVTGDIHSSISLGQSSSTNALVKRDQSVSELSISDDADVHSYTQIEQQMPPPWWAGRFQSRFDQWRTAVMTRQLNPSQSHEYHNMAPLYRYSLEEEKLAAAHILRQLRGLCATNEAADSLWVCLSKIYSHTIEWR